MIILSPYSINKLKGAGLIMGPHKILQFLLRTSLPIVTTIDSLNSGDPSLWFSSHSDAKVLRTVFVNGKMVFKKHCSNLEKYIM